MVKQQVLAALDAARGRYISGQGWPRSWASAAQRCGRLWLPLRSDGIPIEAVTNRGYALAADADVLNAAAVAALLAPEPRMRCRSRSWIGCPVRMPPLRAPCRCRCARGAGADRTGTVCRARARRAQLIPPPGGLYMSILLRPEIGARQAVGLTAMAAVAAARAAEKLCGAPIRIKWVNDLWKNGRKVCGIPDRGRARSGVRYAGLCGTGAGL